MLRLFCAVGLILCMEQANACVEVINNNVGTFIKNGCPHAINLTYCFGECDPPSDMAGLYRSGAVKKVSDRQRRVRVFYCTYPEVPKNNDGKCY